MQRAAAKTPIPDTNDEPMPRGVHVVTGQLHRVRRDHGGAFHEAPPAPSPEPVRRPARVAQMLALAHRLEGAITRGEYSDRAALARKLGLTRARVTQILDLLLLAPDLQEQILFLEAVDGREPLSERMLRQALQAETWAQQRTRWRRVGEGRAAGGNKGGASRPRP